VGGKKESLGGIIKEAFDPVAMGGGKKEEGPGFNIGDLIVAWKEDERKTNAIVKGEGDCHYPFHGKKGEKEWPTIHSPTVIQYPKEGVKREKKGELFARSVGGLASVLGKKKDRRPPLHKAMRSQRNDQGRGGKKRDCSACASLEVQDLSPDCEKGTSSAAETSRGRGGGRLS